MYGVTNAQFCGANAEFADASAGMAAKPRSLSHLEAASVPVVAVTAWQMLFEYAHVLAGQSILILGAGGNVGAYAVQLAARTGLDIVAVAGSKDLQLVRSLGAKTALDYRIVNFEEAIPQVDVLIDTVGGETLERTFEKLKSGGVLVSVVSTKPLPQRTGVRSVFFYAEATGRPASGLTKLLKRENCPLVWALLCDQRCPSAHHMLAGAPHKPAKLCWR